jgi:hypothetical protein
MKANVKLRQYLERRSAWKDSVRAIVRGGVVVCLASGPSLTPDDVALVRTWRDAPTTEARSVFVANTTYRAAPWADLLFAIDPAWWGLHAAEVGATFAGVSYGGKDAPPPARALTLRQFFPYGNTGAGLVALAAHGGACKVVLLGYDGQHTGGATHWHGAHPAPLGDAGSVHKWAGQFNVLARAFRGLPIVNASRVSAIATFPRVALEEALA